MLAGAEGLYRPNRKLPQAAVVTSPRFLESLLAAPTEQAMRELVEDRARLVRTLTGGESARAAAQGRPRSRDQHLVADVAPLDVKAFVRAIT